MSFIKKFFRTDPRQNPDNIKEFNNKLENYLRSKDRALTFDEYFYVQRLYKEYRDEELDEFLKSL